jgi:hypothetical protein
MKALYIAAILLTTVSARAEDPAIHGNHGHDWYAEAELTDAARLRLGVSWKKCCNQSEVVRPKFRVDRTTNDDVWEWFDPMLNRWRTVPADIIHWGEHAPDKRPTLFIHQGSRHASFLAKKAYSHEKAL